MGKSDKETNKYIIVTSLTKLFRILRRPSLTISADYRVELVLEGVPQELNKKLEKKTNRYLHSCGCREGMLSGIVLLAIDIVFRPPSGLVFTSIWLDAILLFLIGAVAGKVSTYAFLYARVLVDVKKAKKYLYHLSN